MNKMMIATTLAGLLLSSTVFANHLTVFNNSKQYAMAIKYRICSGKNCTGPTDAYVPNAKLGSNFIQLDGDYMSITEVTEKDKNGNVRFTTTFPFDSSGKGCMIPPANMFNHPNALILDDIRGSTVITCTQTIVADK